jgi:hypothetical protein
MAREKRFGRCSCRRRCTRPTPDDWAPELERQRALTVRDERYRANVRLAAWLVILTVGVTTGAGGFLDARGGGAPGCSTRGGAERAAPPTSQAVARAAIVNYGGSGAGRTPGGT